MDPSRFAAAALAVALLLPGAVPPAAAATPGDAAPLSREERKQVDGWIRDLGHREFDRRTEATRALRAFGPRALPALREVLRDGSEEARARARLLVLVLEAGRGDDRDPAHDWITLKGDMGRTGARGTAPSRGIGVDAARTVGRWGLDPEKALDAPLAVSGGVLVAACGDRVTALRTSDLKPLWAVGLGRRIASSPVVASGRIFLGTTGGLTALDLETSRELWTVTAAYGVGAAPLASGNTLYACLADESVVALDPDTGGRRWEHRCPAGASAPVLVGNRVVLGLRSGEVAALDAATGARVWTLAVDGMMSFSPAVVGASVVVGDGGRRLRCVDAETGLLLWTRSIQGRFAGDGPAVSPRAIVLATDRMEVEAYDPATGNRLWNRWMGTAHLSSPAMAGPLVLFGSRTRLVAVDAFSGDDAWEIDLDAEVASPLVAENTVFALAGNRVVAVR